MKVIVSVRKNSQYARLNGLTFVAEIRSANEVSLLVEGEWIGGFTFKQVLIVDFIFQAQHNSFLIKSLKDEDVSDLLIIDQFLQNYHLYKELHFEHSYSTCI